MSGFFYKIIFFLNSIAALALLLGYLLPYIPPSTFSALSVLGLFLPLLILINIIFLLFWMITWKRYALLSLIILALGFTHVQSLFQWNSATAETTERGFSVMSYNVRLLNRYHWIADDLIPEKIADFIMTESPDIVGLQEFYKDSHFSLPGYKHQYIRTQKEESGQAIFSKWPIFKKGHLDFSESANNGIFADIAMGKDTLRVFNVHLESLKVDTEEEIKWDRREGEKWVRKVGSAFNKQEEQVEELMDAVEKSPYRVVILGDFNNTSSSYIYRQLTGLLKDSFKKSGRGLGRTFNYRGVPIRIDMILVDLDIKVLKHQNYDIQLSDHYPVLAELEVE